MPSSPCDGTDTLLVCSTICCIPSGSSLSVPGKFSVLSKTSMASSLSCNSPAKAISPIPKYMIPASRTGSNLFLFIKPSPFVSFSYFTLHTFRKGHKILCTISLHLYNASRRRFIATEKNFFSTVIYFNKSPGPICPRLPGPFPVSLQGGNNSLPDCIGQATARILCVPGSGSS